MIAVTHGGKIGDALYALQFARLMYGVHGEKVDFYTSEYCRPMQKLVEYQSYINRFIVPEDYVIESMDCGIQPVEMTITGNYTHVFHCGFRRTPDQALHQFIAAEQGYNIPLAVKYEYTNVFNEILSDTKGNVIYTYKNIKIKSPYICIAPRGKTSFEDTFNDLAQKTNAVIIGGKGDYTGYGLDFTGMDMLDTLSILSHATAFVGLMSSQLVLANGFPIKRIALHDGKSWDMRHVIYTEYNYYPVNPTVDEILTILDK